MSPAEVLTLLRELGTIFGLGDRLVTHACQCRPELQEAFYAAKRFESDMASVDEAIDRRRTPRE